MALKGKQKELDKNKDGKISGEDFKMMKARYGTMAKGNVKEGLKKSNAFKAKLENFKKNSIKKLRGAQVGPAEEAKMSKMMPSMKDSPSTREAKMKAVKMKLSKLKTGGEMKKPMKASLGAIALGVVGAKAAKKLMKKKASAVSPVIDYLGDTAKKSMGGEMKQGYGAARTSGMGLQDEDLIPGKSMDYYKDLT